MFSGMGDADGWGSGPVKRSARSCPGKCRACARSHIRGRRRPHGCPWGAPSAGCGLAPPGAPGCRLQ
eukprot:10711247-Alexandrium_andersonii.AAC.1